MLRRCGRRHRVANHRNGRRLGLRFARALIVPVLAALAPPAANAASAVAQPSASDTGAIAAIVAAMPEYRPKRQVAGTLRLWGHGSPTKPFMRRLVERWERGFAHYQPDVRFVDDMYGTASAIGALYTGAGDLAIMGEEIFPFEAEAYRKVVHHDPASVEVATGSLDVRNFDFAQMIFVHRDNPLAGLTLAQLDAVFGTERRLGAAAPVRTWGQLGVVGPQASHPIHLYAWSLDNDFWYFLEGAFLGGSHRLNGDIKEYAHIHRADGTIYDAGLQMLEALARDPDGIAISNIRYANSNVRPVPVAVGGDAAFVGASRETLVSQAYPLTRTIPIAFNRAPGEALAGPIDEFLRYILSRQGQQDILADDEYLPLSRAALAAQRRKLESAP